MLQFLRQQQLQLLLQLEQTIDFIPNYIYLYILKERTMIRVQPTKLNLDKEDASQPVEENVSWRKEISKKRSSHSRRSRVNKNLQDSFQTYSSKGNATAATDLDFSFQGDDCHTDTDANASVLSRSASVDPRKVRLSQQDVAAFAELGGSITWDDMLSRQSSTKSDLTSDANWMTMTTTTMMTTTTTMSTKLTTSTKPSQRRLSVDEMIPEESPRPDDSFSTNMSEISPGRVHVEDLHPSVEPQDDRAALAWQEMLATTKWPGGASIVKPMSNQQDQALSTLTLPGSLQRLPSTSSKTSLTPSLKSSSISDRSHNSRSANTNASSRQTTMPSTTVTKNKKTPPRTRKNNNSNNKNNHVPTPTNSNNLRNHMSKSMSMPTVSSTASSIDTTSLATMTPRTRRTIMLGKEASLSLAMATEGHRPSLHSIFEWSGTSKAIQHDDLPSGEFVQSRQSKSVPATPGQRSKLFHATMTAPKDPVVPTSTTSTRQYTLTPQWPPKRLSNRNLHAQFYERTMGQLPAIHQAAPAVTAAQMLHMMEPCSMREVLTFKGFVNGFDETSENQLNYSDILDNNSLSESTDGSTVIGQRFEPPPRQSKDPYSREWRNAR